MKKFKKALSLFLAFGVALSIAQLGAVRVKAAQIGDTFLVTNSDNKSINYYVLQDTTTVEVTSYGEDLGSSSYYSGAISIPSTVSHDSEIYRVVGIGGGAFSHSSITSVSIPNSVTFIGQDAFNDVQNTGFTSVTIPHSVKSIGKDAFTYCTALKSVSIPDSVTSISDGAFSDCSDLTSVSIPDSVTSIGEFAFSACSSLTSVSIPDSVTSISDGAFSDCSDLTSVSMPDNVTSIGDKAFYYCTALTGVIIPNNVTSIGESAFADCTALTSVTIPGNVTKIDDSAFSDCGNLSAVYFDGPMPKSLGVGSFDNNTTLNYNKVNQFSTDSNYHFQPCDTKAVSVDSTITHGTVTPSTTNGIKGETVSLQITPGDGYVLKSVSCTDANGNNAEITGNNYFTMPDDQVTVHATFQKVNCVITYDSNGGTPTPPTAIANMGNVILPTAPTRTGYAFSGWKTQDGTDFDGSSAVLDDTTLTAKWTLIHVTGVSLDSSKTLTIGDTATLTATVTPDNALDKSVAWSSSDKSVATVDTTGKVTALKVGTAKITVKTTDGGYMAVCSVTVNAVNRGPGGAITPLPAEISGTQDSGGAYTAQIPYADTTSSVTDVTVKFGESSLVTSASVLSAAISGGNSLTASCSISDSVPQDIQAAAEKAGASGLLVVDLNLSRTNSDGSKTAVHNLSGSVKVTIKLTDAQLKAISASADAKLCYYDPDTGVLSDTGAVFDLAAGTATFTTNHFSSYAVTLKAALPVGVSYASHVQNKGWQDFVPGGLSGTTGEALRAEAFKIKLTGGIPENAEITYQAYIQRHGWQQAVSDGEAAGTTGQGLRLEAFRATLSGLDGYKIRYCAYVQGKGWLDWQSTANGTDITNAAIAGTTGKSLRVEAIEVQIVKAS